MDHGDWDHIPHPVYAYDHYYGAYTPHYLPENMARFGYFLQGYMIFCFQVPDDSSYSLYDDQMSYQYHLNQPNYYHELLNNIPEYRSIRPAQEVEEEDNNDDDDDQYTTSWEEPLLETLDELEEVLIWDLLDEEEEEDQEDDDDDEYLDDDYDGLTEESITKHLKTRFPDQYDEDEDEICVVCQDCLIMQEDDDDKIIATLECGHEYHAGCIKNWLMNKNCCPLCKGTGISILKSV